MREDCGLKVRSPYRDVPSSGKSLGTMRPPAVTRTPGGLPCSLSSLSALPRLMEGEGDGFFRESVGAVGCTATGRRLRLEGLQVRFADADAEGRRTCSMWKSD